MARSMVTRWGMNDAVGPLSLSPRDDDSGATGFPAAKPYSEAMAELIDKEMRRENVSGR